MAGAAGLGRHDGRALGVALLVSLALHIAFLISLPSLDSTRTPAPAKSLQANIVIEDVEGPAKAEPPPPRPATAPPPRPVAKPKPAPQPKPLANPKPAPRLLSPPLPPPAPSAAAKVSPTPPLRPEPFSADESPASPIDTPASVAPSPPASPAAASPPASGPARVAAEQARAAEAAQSLAQYRLQLIGAAGRYKRYPPIARENHWTGTVVVGVVLEPGGRARVSLRRSSGHAVLDEQAVDMFERALRAVPAPAGLRSGGHAFEVRAIYGLED